MTNEQRKKCKRIIHTAAMKTVTVKIKSELVPVFGFGHLVINKFQIKMVMDLASVFSTSLTESAAATLFAQFAVGKIGYSIFQFALGWVPVLNIAINALTAAAVTKRIGWAVAEYFDT